MGEYRMVTSDIFPKLRRVMRYSDPDGIAYHFGLMALLHDDEAPWWEWEIEILPPRWITEWRIRRWLK